VLLLDKKLLLSAALRMSESGSSNEVCRVLDAPLRGSTLAAIDQNVMPQPNVHLDDPKRSLLVGQLRDAAAERARLDAQVQEARTRPSPMPARYHGHVRQGAPR
jgi:hypothetical protein